MTKKLNNDSELPNLQKKSPELIVTLVGNYTDEKNDHRVFEMKYDVNNQKIVDFIETKCDTRYDIITLFKIKAVHNNLI